MNNNMILIYIQSILIIILCLISSLTDFKHKKIYNKYLFMYASISSVVYLIFFRYIDINNIMPYVFNLIITVVLSYMFYTYKIWAAGDAKLFITITYMIPYELYEVTNKVLFPTLYLLIIIFGTAFISIVIESIFLLITRKKTIKKELNIEKYSIKNFINNYVEGFLILNLINTINFMYFKDFYINNILFIYLLNMVILFFVYKISEKKNIRTIITLIALLFNIILVFCNSFTFVGFNYKSTLIVFLIIVLKDLCNKYNYEEIKIDELKPRMILSLSAIIDFYGSNVKNLPHSTTEDTDSRITEIEVDSIKRWSKTKKGKETIVIVRHLPFAPFILIGTIVYFIFRLFV